MIYRTCDLHSCPRQHLHSCNHCNSTNNNLPPSSGVITLTYLALGTRFCCCQPGPGLIFVGKLCSQSLLANTPEWPRLQPASWLMNLVWRGTMRHYDDHTPSRRPKCPTYMNHDSA
ncbi:Uncharacterized protein HZ326_10592 [Fusarium oxysporum f. sp. albedinis]|nr:Uncharacterized protein HZ326_10592 [Fusarium oxysporum f. sp. albedinis]